MRKVLIIYGVLVLVVVGIAILRFRGIDLLPNFGSNAKAEMKGQEFNLEIADSDEEMFKGA